MEVDQNEERFDLESYIANYTSHTKTDRLVFIADKRAGKPIELEALRLAADEVKKSDNVGRYQEIMTKINGRLGANYTVDRNYLEQVDKKCTVKQEKLQAELQTSKTNLIKESIRMGQNDLGDFFFDKGDFQNAFKCYVRTRDYCTTAKHIIHMCLNVIRVSIEMGNFMHVQNYVQKAEQTPEVQQDAIVCAKLRAAAGLAYLDSKKYKLAARKFVEVSPELGNSYSEVIALQDVALYGGLCALASFDRSELKSKVINNITFREFMELVPEVRELVHDFYNSRYASCLALLSTLCSQASLDIHLHDHIDGLAQEVRKRALIQYTAPFTSVDLHTMAAAFNTTVGELEKEIAALIMSGSIQARIDSHSKVLYARHADVRSGTFHRVLAAGEEYMRETRALLLRANLLQHDLVQRPKRGMLGGGGGMSHLERLERM